LHRFGYDISKYNTQEPGQNPYIDMGRFVADGRATTIFDIGANIGQSIERFRLHFPKAQIYSFEPSPTTFRELQSRAAGWQDVATFNFAFGPTNGKAMLNENKHSVMNSMLELGERGWGEIEKRTEVELRTIDEFCRQEQISSIDILKCDTQGYDLEVLRGAEDMMRDHCIGLVYCEVNFAELYRDAAPFDAIFRFLLDRSFVLVGFYKIHFCQQIAGWTDALFVNRVLLKQVDG
jgi:FkbM family methyltransferase